MTLRAHFAGAAAVVAALSITGFTAPGIQLTPDAPSPPGPGASQPAAGPHQPGAAGPHWNTGAPHSPQLLHQLAGPVSRTGMPAMAAPHPRGVDVADYQHPGGAAINWQQVARAGYRFAAIKATEGTYYVNPYGAADVASARRAGLYTAYYHFAIPNGPGGAAQADYAVRQSHFAPGSHLLPFELDIEYNPYGPNECYGLSQRSMVGWIASFSNEIRRLTGQLPMIYTTADWWNTCTGGNRSFGANPLWVAAYGFGSPPLPAGWRTWTFWQFSSSGTVPGIRTPGNTDVDYFNGAQVTLIDPGNQRTTAGSRVGLQIQSLSAAAGETLRYTASGLPPGLTIGGNGAITGIASRAGVYRVTVRAANGFGGAGSVTFTWQV
ncbi:MAG: putative Ig domain-containing protein [Streptosporangiaceae bacterium]|nr:putative Ig domain-containing protein [Streptosporangiaceae bacterium]MBV9853105.1 putative Ig domain-containing protein [Streptosporangiaceae bacterium]